MTRSRKPAHHLDPKPVPATALLFAAAAIMTGCQNNKTDTTVAAPNAPKPVAAPTASPVPTDSTRLKSDNAPFTYVVGPGGNIRLVDVNTNKVILTTLAPPNAIVSVDDTKGVTVANTLVKQGPLPAGHKYELWLDKK
jgi:hypothetical protein